MTEEATDVSEYEAKRLQRVAKNLEKLQALNIPSLSVALPSKVKKKEKRKAEKEPTEPTRKSSRQRKKRKLEKQQRKAEKHERKILRKLEKEERKQASREKKPEKKWKTEFEKEDKQHEVGKLEECDRLYQETHEQEQKLRISDWRLRRKLQAREEKKQATMKKREEKRTLRLIEKLKLNKMKKRERKLRKRQKEKEKLEESVRKELELQRRIEERELMREEDRLARKVAKEEVRKAKEKQLQERNAVVNELMQDIMAGEQIMAREKEDALNREMYPVRKIDLPLVRISDPLGSSRTKPQVLSPLLKVDVNLFHAFSLGKQFLPPGKKSVMQGLCPGGFTAEFQDNVDIHMWKNAMTLFVSGTTKMFYRYMFEEATHHGRKYVFFRWTRSVNVTPPILWRMCRVQKGEEFLHLNKSYHAVPTLTKKPEPLLLFVQYPKGPYIYCGRLGYLGHQPNPLEFSFQLLDINALNWIQIRTLLTNSS